ncbi:hypothetical protein MMC22_005763 [Lobaria immixta]|nr:hypothetical protein [Lobaria immixta]
MPESRESRKKESSKFPIYNSLASPPFRTRNVESVLMTDMATGSLLQPSESVPRTNPERWRIEVKDAIHFWRYLDESESLQHPQSTVEKYFLGLPTSASLLPEPQSYQDTIRNGYIFYQGLQFDDGHWGCGYTGPAFGPGLLFAMYVANKPIPKEWGIEWMRFMATNVNEDGGWGLHRRGPSLIFTTTVNYVALRILGMEPGHPLAANARKCLLRLGGAIDIPQLGKYWLSCLNLYKWEGVIPVPAELWVLPEWVPFHPWRFSLVFRPIFLAASYLYSNKCAKPLDPLLQSLREEIYVMPFSSIIFSNHRYPRVYMDTQRQQSLFLRMGYSAAVFWETYIRPKWLHNKANAIVNKLMEDEEQDTSYLCYAVPSKTFQSLAIALKDSPGSERVDRHIEAISAYMWLGKDGMTSNLTEGVQCWDTAFSVQAAVEAGLTHDTRWRPSLQRALEFLKTSQLTEDACQDYRHPRKGGWPFSTKEQGYIVADCTAEALKAVLLLQAECGFEKIMSDRSLQDSVDNLLLLQNPDGGTGCYEPKRGSEFLEFLNSAELIDNIMIEYSFPECTSSVITALTLFQRHFPMYRSAEVSRSISRALTYLIGTQRKDGSWFGVWAVVNTSWAVLALMRAQYPERSVVNRGLKLIKSRQQSNGEWLQEAPEGAFNKTAFVGYPNYKFYFPIMALGRYVNAYLPFLERFENEKV